MVWADGGWLQEEAHPAGVASSLWPKWRWTRPENTLQNIKCVLICLKTHFLTILQHQVSLYFICFRRLLNQVCREICGQIWGPLSSRWLLGQTPQDNFVEFKSTTHKSIMSAQAKKGKRWCCMCFCAVVRFTVSSKLSIQDTTNTHKIKMCFKGYI